MFFRFTPALNKGCVQLQKYHSKDTSIAPFIFYLTCLLIIYGSTYPFGFSLTVKPELLQEFLQSWHEPSGRGDILGNIALFVPFGFLGCLYFSTGRNTLQSLLRLGVIFLALAIGCQVVQLYIPARSPSLFDVYGNGLGFLVGFAVAVMIGGSQVIRLPDRYLFGSVAPVLIGLWVSVRLLPFVPTIDWQSYKDAVKPLLLAPQFSGAEFLLSSICWIVFAQLGKNILGDRWRTAYLPLSIIMMLSLEVVVVNNTVSLTDVCAGGMAVLVCLGASRQLQASGSVLAWALLGSYTISALFPFVTAYSPSIFHWLPFTGFLEGSMLINAGALSEKLFVLGTVFWFFSETRSLSLFKITFVAFIIFMVEVAQLWREGGTSELTDPLLVLLIGYLFLRLRGGQYITEAPLTTGVEESILPNSSLQITSLEAEHVGDVGLNETGNSPKPIQDAAIDIGVQILRESGVAISPVDAEPLSRPDSSDSLVAHFRDRACPPLTRHRKSVLWVAGGVCLVIMLAAFVVLRLPGVPYNVRELFLFAGNGVDLFFFSVALLGFGWTSAWVGYRIESSSRPVIVGPLVALVASIVIYVLFTFSVTRESIMDVSGSSVFVHRVGSRGVLGQPGIDFVAMVGADSLRGLTDIFEPVIRFGALIGPLIILLGVVLASQFNLARASENPGSKRVFEFVERFFLYLLLMLPWLYFCKVIAFDWSSTDNLNELIARDGYFGLGGGGYLYALVALVVSCAGLLAWSGRFGRGYTVKMVSITVLTLPLAWWLLNTGLSANVNKYGLEFSGVDFLLGPDRQHHLAKMELFWRWAFVYFTMVGGLAFGAGLYLHWVYGDAASCSVEDAYPACKSKNGTATKGNNTIDLIVHFHQYQIDFINRLAEQLNSTFSSTINAIIDCLGGEIHSSSSVEAYVYKQLDEKSVLVPINSMMIPCRLGLSAQVMLVIDELQQRKDISSSRATRKLVDSFIMMSKE